MAELVASGQTIELGQVIGHGANSTVYKAVRHGEPVAVKVLASRKGAFNDTFRQEVAALSLVRHPNLVRIIEFSDDGAQPFLIMEYVEGLSLAERIRASSLSRSEIMDLAVQLADSLHEVHRRGLVHRDIKPENILTTPEGNAKVIDFGLVQRDADGVEGAAVGTLAYASPEQLGLIERRTDERSDLYSLGAVLFEVATGSRPFRYSGATELMQAHLSEVPDRVDSMRPEMGHAFGEIVAKLMAKEPDDRYQTAWSLSRDLKNLENLERDADHGRLALGTSVLGFHVENVAFIAREDELKRLERCVEDACGGTGNVVLVAGEPGSGKSRLVREVVTEDGASMLTLRGKAQQGESTPFAALREALRTYVNSFGRLDSEDAERARARIRSAARGSEAFVRQLDPALARELDDAVDARPLDAAAEERRFRERVSEFLIRLAKEGMALILDDVQWLDESSVALLRTLAGSLGECRLVVLATGRTDPASAKGTAAFVEALGLAKTERIDLRPLNDSDTELLIREHLGQRRVAGDVIDLIVRRASGNPFAIGEYARALLEQGLLRLSSDGWILENADGNIDLPEDVLDLVESRVATLEPSALGVLALGALVGFRFRKSLVARALGLGRVEMEQALDAGIRATLVEIVEPDVYAFIHDRIREAFLSRIEHSGEDVRGHHARVVDALLHAPGDEGASQYERVYALAHHAHAAMGHDACSRTTVFEANLAAARLALREHSNEVAVRCAIAADHASEELALSDGACFELGIVTATALTQHGELDAARARVDSMLELSITQAQEAKLRHQSSKISHGMGDQTNAWKELNRALHLVGAGFPRNPGLQGLTLVYHWAASALLLRTGIGFGSAKGAALERRRDVAEMLQYAWLYSWLGGEPLPLLGTVMRNMHNAHFMGVSPENARARAVYGLIMGALFGKPKPVKKHCDAAIQMARQVGDPEALAYADMCAGFALMFGDQHRPGVNRLVDSTDRIHAFCSAWDQAMTLAATIYGRTIAGDVTDALTFVRKYSPRIEALGAVHFLSLAYGAGYSQSVIVGDLKAAAFFREKQSALVEAHPYKFTRSYLHLHRMWALLEDGEIEDEFDQEERHFLDLKFDEFMNRHGYLLPAYARLERLRKIPTREAFKRKDALAALRGAIQRATFGPPPRGSLCKIHRCHLNVLKGALAREEGNLGRAHELLSVGKREADISGSLWAQFTYHRELARLHQSRHEDAAKETAATDARDLALRHGWVRRARAIAEEFSIEMSRKEGVPPVFLSSMDRTPTSQQGWVHAQRHVDTLLKVSAAAAESLDEHTQTEKALSSLVEELSAERGAVYLSGKDGRLEFAAGWDRVAGPIAGEISASTTVLARVFESQEAMVVAGSEEGEVLGSESAIAQNLRSIVAAPISTRESRIGVLYLDSRVVKGLFGKIDVAVVSSVAKQLAISLELGRLAEKEARNREARKNLELAASVQSLLLPKRRRYSSDWYDIQAVYEPAFICSGDWWWVDSRPDGVRAFLADVTGHGAPAAMMTAVLATAYRREIEQQSSGEALLKAAHEAIRAGAQGQYGATTSLIECVRNASGGIRCAWYATSCPILVVLKSTGVTGIHHSGGSPLGGTAFSVRRANVDVSRGDAVLMFTDGAFEFRAKPAGRMLNMKGLVQIIERRRALTPQDRLQAIADDIRGIRVREADDDLTLIGISIK